MRLVPSAGAIYMDKLLELENQEKCLQLRANRNELQHQLQLKLEEPWSNRCLLMQDQWAGACLCGSC